MTYGMIRLRNIVSGWFPRSVGLLERLPLSATWLAARYRGEPLLPMPSELKRAMIARVAKRTGARYFVETGTYMADTPWQLKSLFDRIWTIEVHPPLAKLARERFRREPTVAVVEGDSGQALKDIVPLLDQPTLFWLDGHYSAGITGRGKELCPIFAELDAVFEGTKVPFVALIDDARLFGRDEGYPSVEAMKTYFDGRAEAPHVWLENDIFFVVPRQSPMAATLEPVPFVAPRSILY